VEKLVAIPGSLPSPAARPRACRFHPRCFAAEDICRREEPQLRPVASGAVAACHFAETAVANARAKVDA
jgi:oligopeptide/dipeptide ABC transporter ATP-binding protein